MSPRGSKQKPTAFKVEPRPVSPDDVKSKMRERDRLAVLDDRDDVDDGSAIRRNIDPHWRAPLVREYFYLCAIDVPLWAKSVHNNDFVYLSALSR